jgi:hypothetical protein
MDPSCLAHDAAFYECSEAQHMASRIAENNRTNTVSYTC